MSWGADSYHLPLLNVSAGSACQWGYLGVNVHVLLQANGVAEGLPANAAAERPGTAVGASHVHLQSVRSGEDLRRRGGHVI